MDIVASKEVVRDTVSAFHAFHIPIVLYEGLKGEFGTGEEWEQNGHQLSHLNETRVGFPGVIACHEKVPHSLFCMWPSYTDPLFSHIAPARLLQVTAQEIPWGGADFGEKGEVVGYGTREAITVRFFSGQARELSCPTLPFTLWVWQKTLEIYQSKNRQPERSFWVRT